MNLIFILQVLWRRRIVVGVAVLLSLGVGASVAYRVTPGLPPHFKSRRYQVGLASVRVLVDTHDSIVADLDPTGADSLSLHAQLLADLIASGPVRTGIAQAVGIPPQYLAVVPPAVSGAPAVATPIATAAPPPADASTLTIGVDSTLPLVSISAQAPSRTQAATLAGAAVVALRRYVLSVAAAQKISATHRPVITSLGIQSASATRGPSRIYGVAAALVLFSLFCYAVLVISSLRQRIRTLRSQAGPAAVASGEPDLPMPESDSPQALDDFPEALDDSPEAPHDPPEAPASAMNGNLPRPELVPR